MAAAPIVDSTQRVVELYSLADERPHQGNPSDPHWQESIFFWWWDDEAGVGAIHRIGHEPNTPVPSGNSWNGVFTRDGDRFRRYARPALQPGDWQPGGLSSGPSRYAVTDQWHFTLTDPDCEVDLVWFENFTPLGHVYPQDTMLEVHADYAAQHYEVSGRVRGTARIGERTYQVDALAYRDHSWGRREWPTLLAHRYLGGTVGPELTFCALGWLGLDGGTTQFGVVCRDGVYEYAESIDFLTYFEIDGTTHRGGEITFTLRGGETIALKATLVDAVLHEHGGHSGHAISAVDSICTVQYEGLTGMANLEITNNPRNGLEPVRASIRAISENGLTRRDWRFC